MTDCLANIGLVLLCAAVVYPFYIRLANWVVWRSEGYHTPAPVGATLLRSTPSSPGIHVVPVLVCRRTPCAPCKEKAARATQPEPEPTRLERFIQHSRPIWPSAYRFQLASSAHIRINMALCMVHLVFGGIVAAFVLACAAASDTGELQAPTLASRLWYTYRACLSHEGDSFEYL